MNEEQSQLQQLSTEIDQLERDILALRNQADHKMHHLAEETTLKINRLTDQMIISKLRLARLRGDVRCPVCQMPNKKDNPACLFCGQALNEKRKDT